MCTSSFIMHFYTSLTCFYILSHICIVRLLVRIFRFFFFFFDFNVRTVWTVFQLLVVPTLAVCGYHRYRSNACRASAFPSRTLVYPVGPPTFGFCRFVSSQTPPEARTEAQTLTSLQYANLWRLRSVEEDR